MQPVQKNFSEITLHQFVNSVLKATQCHVN